MEYMRFARPVVLDPRAEITDITPVARIDAVPLQKFKYEAKVTFVLWSRNSSEAVDTMKSDFRAYMNRQGYAEAPWKAMEVYDDYLLYENGFKKRYEDGNDGVKVILVGYFAKRPA